ncbi:hypothetical protein ACFHW2_19370 [Actinomadura sp. LOL_016]|uniref:hypothetical protein n=1 Tax=unclassified Actinomadura TaxID=2626254 RepID=UPI003A7FC799
MDFTNAARELYGVEPGGFVEARNRLVRRAKDAGDAALAKRIGGLRRPTASAWAVNLLARSAADDLGRLLDVGDGLRTAWGSGGGLGDLEERRARLIGGLLRTAESLTAEAGHPVRDQAVREVEDTLQAATVDADVAAEVREGTLSRPRSHTGFVPAGFPMAPDADEPRPTKPTKEKRGEREAAGQASPEKTKPHGPADGGRAGRARARERAEALRERAAETDRELAGREEAAASARDAAGRASAEVERLRHELERAVADRDAAVRKAERAEQARERAGEAARRARQKAREADRDARGR